MLQKVLSFIKIICISNYTRYLILIKLIKYYIIPGENNNNKKDKWKIFKKYKVVILSLIYLRNNLIQSFYKIILSLNLNLQSFKKKQIKLISSQKNLEETLKQGMMSGLEEGQQFYQESKQAQVL